MDEIKINTEGKGLDSLYAPHTALLLKHLWDLGGSPSNGVSIKDLHEWYNVNAHDYDLKEKSRSTIRDSLNELQSDGVVRFYQVLDQGGNKRMYYQQKPPSLFAHDVKQELAGKIGDIFKGAWYQP